MEEKTMRKHFLERFSSRSGGDFSKTPGLPLSLNVELNSTCNHKCIFCPYHGETAPHPVGNYSMDFDLVIKILDEAWSLGIGKKELGFYASGEPFLYKKLPEVIAYAKKKGFCYTFLTTNGSLATPDRIKAVVDAGLDSIRFSVNACEREQYEAIHGRDDFNKVYNNIKFLSEYREKSGNRIAISLSCVVTRKTDGMQQSIREQFKDFVDDIIFLPVSIEPEMQDALKDHVFEKDLHFEINESFICNSIFDAMYIDAKADVVVCCQGCGREDAIAYHLSDGLDLKKAWESPVYQEYRKMFLEHTGLKGTICEQCYLVKRVDEGFFQE